MPTPAAVELLAALSAVLRSQGCRWYLFGAQAVLLYGEPRLTADVDVTVEVLPARIRPLVDGLEEVGFRLRVKDADTFVARTSVHVAVFGATGAGKTYVAKTVVEEAVLAGVPVLAFDIQGDLAARAWRSHQEACALRFLQ